MQRYIWKINNSLTRFVGISLDWTAFLIFEFVIRFSIFSFVTVSKTKEEFVPSICFVIKIILGWFWYLQIAFSIGSCELSVVLRNSCWVVKPKLGTIFTKKLLKKLATSSSSFISTPFSLKTIFLTDFISLEKRGLTIAQNF